ncbi:four-helix bundle copper-binding protein [Marinitenerispora sediminis]|uniref:Four-helix bundle copper-binding protein n=1 Tax=Marinitenerispora sediminis TaxID=1931232 RepID=A0A368T0R5_9ACTN|nr:four-helix bundle copper-binding protein [Marinitenerispora sediminis]RCV49996.1 four-helix bundle copper-binding protein [Marinitenerispora sediminis]RCV51300.1 four-helix bundle copper-binding protein [Marinitenerispora sediminis]RCV53205.1 four-helix bundle copper-binding protein [Marinitenerispora sediminis]
MATQTEIFLRTHPQDVQGDLELITRCVERLAACVQSCTACADACLGEVNATDLVTCIRRNLDCADVCAAAEQVLTRRTAPDPELDRSLLETCVRFCGICAAECARHADSHEHCRLCADTCRLCEDACRQLLTTLPKAPAARRPDA